MTHVATESLSLRLPPPTAAASRTISSSTAYAAWLVDFDGTLYRQLPVRLAMAAELLLAGPRKIRIIRHFRSQQELLRRGDNAGCTSAYRLQLERTAGVTGETVAL